MAATDSKQQYERLLQAHRGIVYKVAYAYSRTAEDRDDLVQEICLQLWRSFPSYDPARRFSTWMYRVALNVAISHLRRASRDNPKQLEPLDAIHLETVGAGEDRGEDERLDALRYFIDRLEPLNRTVMMLYLDECSYAEIAAVIGLSETNVATKINRIKNELRGQMAGKKTGA